ncbi:tryptophan halogenase family protein [Massilia sp. TS11]|uniref:tryptophan halogenase family protein n=1 Tax=Massilia sp. TS11 TaxID=2908003 RepID=UPI001EDC662A|nr:tryptophan halogenase family protein [Massilia sp. TS11]MCG2586762.1 tryptophan 7-halogenase [Massilia sp. TS11]
MDDLAIRDILIVGGGTAGWMTAAALAALLPAGPRIRLVESEQIGAIGVGEATIPHIRTFNAALGIDEDAFLRATQGSFKLGIEFVDWRALGSRYIHGFGKIGPESTGLVSFYQYWLRQFLAGTAPDLAEFSINTVAPRHNKFMRGAADMPNSPLADIAYAFHFDASLYARFLRSFSDARGVERIEGRITRVRVRDADGHIAGVDLDDGRALAADLYIDCSGMAALLLGAAQHVPFEDWSHWLPCDSALAVPSAPSGPLLPYTRSTAHTAGWQWRIPLQHRVGNGHVFASRFMDEDEARAVLLRHLDGEALAAPRLIRFRPGRRARVWQGNCVAIGLSAGFLEPLESTSIHLIQSGITRLLHFFPTRAFDQVDIDAFNAQTAFEYERIRDFIILHYHQTERSDSPFWAYCRRMEVPDSLRRKLALYRSHGRIVRDGEELFTEVSWLQVMHGQGLRPQACHPLVDQRSPDEIRAMLANVAGVIRKCVDVMPRHEEFIAACCAAPKESA